jgi:hypothetical protein
MPWRILTITGAIAMFVMSRRIFAVAWTVMVMNMSAAN